MNYAATLLLVFFLMAAAGAQPNRLKDAGIKEKELAALKSYLATARDSLQNEIAARWRQKQRFVEQRETDKEELDRLRELQERAHADFARAREEGFAKERQLEDERKEMNARKDEWQLLGATIAEALAKESDRILEAFPLDREQRRRDLEELRRAGNARSDPAGLLGAFSTYLGRYISNGMRIAIDKQTVVPDEGDARQFTFARFGHLFGYGIDEKGEIVYVRQTGNLGSERYGMPTVGPSVLKDALAVRLPQWIAAGSVQGAAPVDVMQNDQSRILISGKKIRATTRIAQFVKDGGPVMIPLLLLPVWALILVALKLIQFSRKDRTNKTLCNGVIALLEKKEIDKAKSLAEHHPGVVARVVRTCLEHSKWKRQVAEKRVREILLDEVPQLNKHLATIAVIAGVAPLLGLLGTVTGMISLFQVITHYGTGDPKILAGGISEALITTQTGLMIAIPLLLVHNSLRNRSNRILSEIEKHAIRILNRLWPEE